MMSQAPVYSGFEHLYPVAEVSRGRFGAGVLIVYDEKKCDHVTAKRVAKRDEETFERQVTIHIRASTHANVVRFLGLLPSSTSCFQYAIEHIPEGDLRHLVVNGVGLPDVACKIIFRQLLHCLEYLHKELGVVHGSLRPDHVLMASVSHCSVKISNFSSAYPIGSRVKMNTRGGTTRSMTWRKQLNRLKSFLTHRTSSLRIPSGSGGRNRRPDDPDTSNHRVEEEDKDQAGMRRRRRSVSFVRNSSLHPNDLHEYTVDDILDEIENHTFAQAFIPPELVNATRYVASPAADNWSLMILMLFCVTGHTPWEVAAVDNRKYTAFLHSSRRSKSFTPNLNNRGGAHPVPMLSKLRSKSLSSLVESLKRITSNDRLLSPVFENKLSETLKQPADQRISLHFCSDFYSRKWSEDSMKWDYYRGCNFDQTWMLQQQQHFQRTDSEGEMRSKRRKADTEKKSGSGEKSETEKTADSEKLREKRFLKKII